MSQMNVVQQLIFTSFGFNFGNGSSRSSSFCFLLLLKSLLFTFKHGNKERAAVKGRRETSARLLK